MVLTWFSSLFWILCFSSINTFNQLVLRMSFKCSWKMRCSIWSETIFQVYEQEYKKDLTLLMLLSSRHLKQFWCIIPTNETFVRSDRAAMALLSRKRPSGGTSVSRCAASRTSTTLIAVFGVHYPGWPCLQVVLLIPTCVCCDGLMNELIWSIGDTFLVLYHYMDACLLWMIRLLDELNPSCNGRWNCACLFWSVLVITNILQARILYLK
jgi:hypothetical protein